MALLGQAAIAMWWDIAPEVRAEFEHWHAHEHFPERLGLPGFRRGTRWVDSAGGDSMFVMYELEGLETISSAAYVARLNAPTPWSARLMPHHRNMVRSQCQVVATSGSGIAGHAITFRWSSDGHASTAIESSLRMLVDEVPLRPGLTGAHLLRHTPPNLGPTTEQRIRALSDRSADGAFVVVGYDPAALEALIGDELVADHVVALGAQEGSVVHGRFTLACSATTEDIA